MKPKDTKRAIDQLINDIQEKDEGGKEMKLEINIPDESLNEILQKHKLWIEGDPEGTRADLSGANLSRANLRWADLSGANLSGAYLSGADLSGAYLSGANLSGADLSRADLSGANLSGANLSGADLSRADLSRADLRGANLRWADLSRANLTNVKVNHTTVGYHLVCPEEGTFIGFKKTCEGIVKLEIPADALRSSATTRKCRCSKAKVLEIPKGVTEAHSVHDYSFIYRLGEIVEVKDYDTNRWNECSSGIHFFMTRAEAEAWDI